MKQKKFSFQPYPFIMLLTALVTGILLQDNFERIPSSFWLSGLILCTVLSLAFQLLHSRQHFIASCILLLSFIFLGGTLCYIRNAKNHASWYGRYTDQARAFKIQLDEEPAKKPKTLLLKVSVQSVSIADKWIPADGKLLVYIYKKELRKQFHAGQTFIIPNKLAEIRSSGNPFAFDQQQYANRNGLFHQCFLKESEIWALDKAIREPGTISRFKTSVQTVIEKNIKDETTKALVLATIINERATLQPELVNAYSTTGIIHIIAISGMHIILLASIILLTIGKVPVIQNSKYLWATILVWIYIAITGFPPSAVRAAVMFSIFALGNILKRDGNQLNTWAASGFLLLCYHPYWIYDVGFQLSYLAVLSLLLFTKSITDWWQPGNWFLRNLWKGIAVSISVQILVFPLVIYYFNQFPLLVFIANIPAGIFSTVLMIGVMILIAFSNLGLPSIWIGNLLTGITKVFHSFIFVLSEYSPGGLRSLYIDKLEYWLVMAIITSLCIFLYFKKQVYLFAGLAISILFAANFISKEYAALHQDRIVVYNTGNESNLSLIKGKEWLYYYPFSENAYKYTLKPAMLGFRTKNRQLVASISDIFLVHNKSILILGQEAIAGKKSFPVDVLIVSGRCRFKPEIWFEAFHPKLIVIDGSVPRWKALKWMETLAKAGATVKWVGDSGAWIYPDI